MILPTQSIHEIMNAFSWRWCFTVAVSSAFWHLCSLSKCSELSTVPHYFIYGWLDNVLEISPTQLLPLFRLSTLKLAFTKPSFLLLVQFPINIKHSLLSIRYRPNSLGEFLTQTTILTEYFVHTLLLMQHYQSVHCAQMYPFSQLCPKLLKISSLAPCSSPWNLFFQFSVLCDAFTLLELPWELYLHCWCGMFHTLFSLSCI